MSISVLILTYNEEVNLPSCLASVSWSDDVVVLDSFSTDRTVEIARASGARVIQRAWDGERGQRTFAIRGITFRHPWVYNPDADEVTTPELALEMRTVVDDPTRLEVAYRIRPKIMFMGRWLRHSSLYPTWQMRLFQPDRLSYDRDIHLRCRVDGAEGRLEEHFLHYNFGKGLDAWIEKHNKYASIEAVEAIRSLQEGAVDWRGIFGFRDPVRRRAALKELSFRAPCRPLLRFLYMYVVRRGFLDGWPGYLYCRLIATYEFFIVTKIVEMRRRERGLSI